MADEIAALSLLQVAAGELLEECSATIIEDFVSLGAAH